MSKTRKGRMPNVKRIRLKDDKRKTLFEEFENSFETRKECINYLGISARQLSNYSTGRTRTIPGNKKILQSMQNRSKVNGLNFRKVIFVTNGVMPNGKTYLKALWKTHGRLQRKAG